MSKIINIEKAVKAKIRGVNNWPKEGVTFRDITPLLEDGRLFRNTINAMAKPYLEETIDKIVGIDARGFIFSAALAYKLRVGLAIVRKKGKLPPEIISQEYSLEYGTDVIEMRKDAILPGEKVLIIDDVLATGGTMRATVDLIKQLKGHIIGIGFLLEVGSLKGREKLKGYPIKSLVKYDH